MQAMQLELDLKGLKRKGPCAPPDAWFLARLSGPPPTLAQARLQFDALQQQWEGASAAVDALKAEGRRLKRHLARMERRAEVRAGWGRAWAAGGPPGLAAGQGAG
jgi:hypothetical protein